jgi:hypothetical protein
MAARQGRPKEREASIYMRMSQNPIPVHAKPVSNSAGAEAVGPRNPTPKAALLRGFSRPRPRRIRDPHLRNNPRPRPAESATSSASLDNPTVMRSRPPPMTADASLSIPILETKL